MPATDAAVIGGPLIVFPQLWNWRNRTQEEWRVSHSAVRLWIPRS